MFDTFGEKSLDHLIDVCTRRFEEHEREANKWYHLATRAKIEKGKRELIEKHISQRNDA